MEGACWGKDSSGSGARLLQWSQLSVPALPVIAFTADITLTLLKKEHDTYVFSLIKCVMHAYCNVRRHHLAKHYTHHRKIHP